MARKEKYKAYVTKWDGEKLIVSDNSLKKLTSFIKKHKQGGVYTKVRIRKMF